jgi:phosphatidylinositol alpha-1,6-mannosyltransferase
VLDGETGVVVDGRSATVVAESVTRLLTDPAKARAMGERGREWVTEQWSWDRSLGRLSSYLT